MLNSVVWPEMLHKGTHVGSLKTARLGRIWDTKSELLHPRSDFGATVFLRAPVRIGFFAGKLHKVFDVSNYALMGSDRPRRGSSAF